MRFWLLVPFLPGFVHALRKQRDGDAEVTEHMRMNASFASDTDVEADVGVELGAGVVLRERYVLQERITKELGGPGQDFPHQLQRKYKGAATHLGTGSFGDTWKAYDSHLQQYVAVKIFYDRRRNVYLTWKSADRHQQAELKENAEECAMVKNMMAESYKHEGSKRICQCFEEHVMDAMGTDKPVFLVLEMCGTELAAVLHQYASMGKTNVAKARQWARQAIEGIAFLGLLHPPLIHHDLKPGNLVVDGDELKIIDFGGTMKGTPSNQYGGSVYTPSYCAPEVSKSNGSVAFQMPAHSYDVYALGLIYAGMLCPKVSYKQWMNLHTGIIEPISSKAVERWMALCPDLAKDSNISNDVRLIAHMVSTKPADRPSPLTLLKYPGFEKSPSGGHGVSSPPTPAPTASAEYLGAQHRAGEEVLMYNATLDKYVKAKVSKIYRASGEYMYDLTTPEGKPLKKGVRETYLMMKISGVNWH